jgi:hypothetical protein
MRRDLPTDNRPGIRALLIAVALLGAALLILLAILALSPVDVYIHW